MRRRVWLVMGLTVWVAGSIWLSAQQSRPYPLMSRQDYYEIEQLVLGYTHGVDVGPEDGAWVYTPDGEFVGFQPGSVVTSTKGEKALKEMYSRLRKTNESRQSNHLLTNLVVTPTKDGATGSVYLTEFQGGDKSEPTIVRFGRYSDTYVRTPQGWRIKRREFHQMAPGRPTP